MRKTGILMTALALILVLGSGMGSALAYFTTYARAAGGHVIELGDRTEMTEEFSSWTKHVAITADADSQLVYVRARAYAGSTYELSYSDEAGLWRDGGDGWYYYDSVLYGGEAAGELLIRIDNVPEEVRDSESFDVVVVYEYTPVQYDAEGQPYADWTLKVDNGEGGGE